MIKHKIMILGLRLSNHMNSLFKTKLIYDYHYEVYKTLLWEIEAYSMQKQ